MHNPFKRAACPETARPTLRERLAATKAKAKQVLAVNAVILKGPPAPAPVVDRTALVNYATWLHFERYRVCGELYPHLGTKAVGFVLTANAAERFFWPNGIGNLLNRSVALPPASSRAVKVLDLVGVDWRSDVARGGLGHVDTTDLRDNGERPALPYGWPAPDAALTTALIDMCRIHDAIDALPSTLDREHHDLPEFKGLDEAVDEAIGTLVHTQAVSLAGLQAKSKAILSDPIQNRDIELNEVAQSLARDILGATNRTITPEPDPILCMIAEGRRLLRDLVAAYAASEDADDDDPRFKARNVLMRQMWDHIDGVVLKTVPQTGTGCRELARFEIEFFASQGVTISNDERTIVGLIARSPLL